MTERVVLDPSVIIAAAIRPTGPTAAFLRRWVLRREFEVIWTQKLGYELDEDLHVKKGVADLVSPRLKEHAVKRLERHARLVDDVKLDNTLALAHDRDDDYLVALARREKAIVVTLDRKLIEHCPPDVRAMRPHALLKELESA